MKKILTIGLLIVLGSMLHNCSATESVQEISKEISTLERDKFNIVTEEVVETLEKVLEKNSALELEKVRVIKVIDGDTLKVERENGDIESVRLIGVNTPESVAPDSYRVENSEEGSLASIKVKTYFENNNIEYVYLEKDISDRDIYDRLLRYVWVEKPDVTKPVSSEMSTKMLNALLLSDIIYDNGYPVAEPVTYLPDVKYADLFFAIYGSSIAVEPKTAAARVYSNIKLNVDITLVA